MSERAHAVVLDDIDARALARAFESARVRRVTALRLVIDGAQLLTPEFTAAVVAELGRTPSIQHLVLDHPRMIARFIATSIALSAPGVHVSVDVEARAEAEADMVARRVRIAAGNEGGAASPMRTAIIRFGEDGRSLAQVFADARTAGVRALVLTIAIERPLDPAFRDALIEQLAGADWLRALALVHPNAAIGFLASTLALRCTGMQVRGFSRLEDAEAMIVGL